MKVASFANVKNPVKFLLIAHISFPQKLHKNCRYKSNISKN